MDAGKGLSILLVVLYHATGWMANAGYTVGGLPFVNEVLTGLRMPVFFFLSGLFALKWIDGTWRALFASKILLLAWVYLLWSLIELPFKWLSMWALTGKVGNDFFATQALVIAAIPLRASSALWFIWALIFFFVAAKLTRSWPVWLQLAISAGLSLGVRALPTEVDARFVELGGIGYRGALLCYVFFIAGCYLRKPTERLMQEATVGLSAAILTLWLSLRVGLEALGGASNFVASFLISATGVAAGLCAARLLSSFRALGQLGERTLPVYVSHASILIVITCGLSLLPHVDLAIVGVPLTLTVAAAAVALGLVLFRGRARYQWLFEPPRGFSLAGPSASASVSSSSTAPTRKPRGVASPDSSGR